MSQVTDSTISVIENPVGIKGLEFIEFTGPDPLFMDKTFRALGFSRLMQHKSRIIYDYRQNNIHFLLNQDRRGFADAFGQLHGPSVSAIALRVDDAQKSFETAVERGARPYEDSEDKPIKDHDLPAVYGVGESLIYFVDQYSPEDNYYSNEFNLLDDPVFVKEKGFQFVDHLTNNVTKGTRDEWTHFYCDIFGFYEIRYFDIKGQKTGLTSFALKSPCHTFSIPINEGTEEKSQIEEYLREYKGPGVQHIALATYDLLKSLDNLEGSGIEALDIDDDYYEEAFARVPNVTEDKEHIKRHQVLIDGDAEGYLLQIFTKNLFGPIFFEMIQRKNHHSFGEGNFGALFRAIERDQERRGTL